MRISKLKLIFSGLSFAAAVAVSPLSHAGSTTGARITSIQHTSGGNVIVRINKSLSGGTTCSTKTAFVLTASTNEGRSLVALANSAMLAGKLLDVAGSNTCSGSFETVSSITVID